MKKENNRNIINIKYKKKKGKEKAIEL